MINQNIGRFFMICAILFGVLQTEACQYKVALPEHDIAMSLQDRPCPPKIDKYSYFIVNGTPIIHKALEDSFTTCGIDDLIVLRYPNVGRKHLNVYILSPNKSSLRRFLEFPYGLISPLTLYIIPAGGDIHHPFEAHWVNPDAKDSSRIVVIKNEWVENDWTWLPFLLVHDDGEKGKGYNLNTAEYQDRIVYEGWRRIFDELVREVNAELNKSDSGPDLLKRLQTSEM